MANPRTKKSKRTKRMWAILYRDRATGDWSLDADLYPTRKEARRFTLQSDERIVPISVPLEVNDGKR